MAISQLPKIEIPTEEALNDEDKHILDAFKILLNGYQRSQGRLRAVSKAYATLESIAQSLLKERHENDRKSPEKQETTLFDKNNQKKTSPLQLHKKDSRDDILTVDLTFDFESLEQSVDTNIRRTSPVFEQQRKRSRKHGGSAESATKDSKQKIESAEAGSFMKKVADREENALENEAAKSNEENTPPLCNSNFRSSDNTENHSTLFFNKSKPIAKIGLTKTVYNIDPYKTTDGKRSKQSILVFQPVTSKMNLSCSEKQTAKSNVSRKWGNLFDENYRNANKSASGENNCQERIQKNRKIIDKDLIEKKSERSLTSEINVTTSKGTLRFDKGQKPKETCIERKDKSIVIETPSQINETARSLFDDEDLNDFDVSKDLLNTCMASPVIVDNAVQPVIPNILKKTDKSVGAIASTAEASQSFHALDSIDETFFAPGEIEMPKRDVEKMENITLKPDCSEIVNTKNSRNKNRNLKRKSGDTQVEAAKEFTDFGVQDIDWDQDISDDNWPPPKRHLNDSFDIIPEKKKKSPNYAYKGKVERNKAERAKLRGWNCEECEKYYENLNLTDEELKKRMNRCSRHRSKYNQRYLTPKDFWNPVFPDTTDSSDFSESETSYSQV